MKTKEEIFSIVNKIFLKYSKNKEFLNYDEINCFLDDIFNLVDININKDIKDSIFVLLDKNKDNLIDKNEFYLILEKFFNFN